jgi:subtilisin family serine protease
MIRNVLVTAVVTMLLAAVLASPAAAGGNHVAVTAEVVIKVDGDSATVADVAARNDGFVMRPVIASRGVYLVGTMVLVEEDKVVEKTDDEAEDWAKDLAKDDDVVWSQPVVLEDLEDTRFHAWPDGDHDGAAPADLADQAFYEYLALEQAHQDSTGTGVVVAVLDTGLDASHPFLAGRVAAGYDLLDDDTDPTDEGNGVDDDGDGLIDEAFGHGTFVAGLVLQVAPDATILPIRVLDADGRSDVAAVAEGIDLAIELGADIINLSAGFPSNEKPHILKDALKRAKEADVVVIVAAGNTGVDSKVYPASESSVISVGAFGFSDIEQVTDFSAHGSWVAVAAPGVGLVSAIPGGGYAEWAGTSMAAPIVAGSAALLVDLDPDADGKDIAKALEDGAQKMHGDDHVKKGRIDILASFDEL